MMSILERDKAVEALGQRAQWMTQVCRRDAGNNYLVALFILEADAKEWVKEQNAAMGQDLYVVALPLGKQALAPVEESSA